jgi:hypothetical protein
MLPKSLKVICYAIAKFVTASEESKEIPVLIASVRAETLTRYHENRQECCAFDHEVMTREESSNVIISLNNLKNSGYYVYLSLYHL